MHEDSSLTTGRVRRVLNERVRPAIYSAAAPLEVSASPLAGEPIALEEGLSLAYAPFSVGEEWGPAWGTTWFRFRGTVPSEWSGRTVEAVIDLGFDPNMTGFQCEGLVYRSDGTPVKSLNPRNQWLPISSITTDDGNVEFFVEGASNPVLLDYTPFLPTQEGDIQTSSPRPLYRLRRADLVVFESEVFELSLDLDVLLELQAELPETSPRRMRILQALDNALDELDLQRISETAGAARAELTEVLAAPADASAHKISAVGHAHIDSAWLWPVRETIRKVARTTSSMTELIDETSDFVYGMSSAQQYAWIKEHRPEVYERVRAAVEAGRFLPLGGMWVESDTVMPTGESLARQFLYGQRFFEREFGIRSKGVWLPDSFGYSPALPQLMRRAGFEWFFTQKISWNQHNVFPHHTFLWEGIDGSRMFTHFPPMDTYNSQLSGLEIAKASRQFKENRVARRSLAPVGWGDGGGGTTREMVGRAERLGNLEGSAQVSWQHPDEFFDEARAELEHPAVWVGELYLELHRGTLTSQHATKATHRRAEHALLAAELWATTAAVRLGDEYPAEELDTLWESVLLHEFHDILPGTSIAWVHREAVSVLTDVVTRATTIADAARRRLAGEGHRELAFHAVTARGADAGSAVELAQREPATLTETDDGFLLENAYVRITISRDGLVTSAIDRESGREAIAPGETAGLLQLHQDFPNMWDAWDIDRFYKNRVTDLRDAASVSASVVDRAATVRVERAFGDSTLVQTFSLSPESPTLTISIDADWHETEKLLKLAFPLDVFASHTDAETQYGFQSRPTHVNTSWEAAKFETSMHRFVMVREPEFGVAVLNDSVYGYDTAREAREDGVTTTVRVSLLRAPRFPDPDTDHGRHVITVGLIVGADATLATEEGARLNAPPAILRGAEAITPLVRVEGDGIVLSSVKLAADGSGDVIARVYESRGIRATGSLVVDGLNGDIREVTLIEDDLPEARTGADFSMTPFEVRTFRITR